MTKELQKINLSTVIFQSSKNKELVQQFDRLHNTNLSFDGSVLDLEIDKCSGRLNADLQKFIEFVYDKVFLTLEPNVRGKIDVNVIGKLLATHTK